MSYADKNYDRSKDLYASLSQVFEDYKHGKVSSQNSWNQLMHDVNGITMRYLGENLVEFTYHRYETETVEGLERMKNDDPGMKFLANVVKGLKKEFKNDTGKPLTMKKIKEQPVNLEKASRITAETSWMLGASRYGHGSRPVGRYLVKTSCIYDFSANL